MFFVVVLSTLVVVSQELSPLCPQSGRAPTECCADATSCGVHVVACRCLRCLLSSLSAVDDAVLHKGVGGLGGGGIVENIILMHFGRLPMSLSMSAEFDQYHLYYDNL